MSVICFIHYEYNYYYLTNKELYYIIKMRNENKVGCSPSLRKTYRYTSRKVVLVARQELFFAKMLVKLKNLCYIINA